MLVLCARTHTGHADWLLLLFFMACNKQHARYFSTHLLLCVTPHPQSPSTSDSTSNLLVSLSSLIGSALLLHTYFCLCTLSFQFFLFVHAHSITLLTKRHNDCKPAETNLGCHGYTAHQTPWSAIRKLCASEETATRKSSPGGNGTNTQHKLYIVFFF